MAQSKIFETVNIATLRATAVEYNFIRPFAANWSVTSHYQVSDHLNEFDHRQIRFGSPSDIKFNKTINLDLNELYKMKLFDQWIKLGK